MGVLLGETAVSWGDGPVGSVPALNQLSPGRPDRVHGSDSAGNHVSVSPKTSRREAFWGEHELLCSVFCMVCC